MASAGWDEVLGGGGDGFVPDDDGDDDGAAVAKKKRIPTGTKILLVLGAWILLTLFLVGRFTSEKAQPSATAKLDTVSGEAVDPEPVDTEEEAALDADGDGFLSAEEQGITDGSAAAAADGAGAASSEAQAYEGTPGGSGGATGTGSAGGDGGSGTAAVPGAPPGGAGGGSGGGGGTTSTTAAGGSGGGGNGTTSTTKPGSTTSTTKQGGGTTTSSTTTTTAPPTTTTTTGANVPSTASSTYKGRTVGFLPTTEVTVRLDNGTAEVTITNDTDNDHDFKVGSATYAIDKHKAKAIAFHSAGDFTVTVVNSSKTLTVHVQA
jgi:hypothetical protein